MQTCLYYSVFGNVLGGYRNGAFMEKTVRMGSFGQRSMSKRKDETESAEEIIQSRTELCVGNAI
jgi:hypothetical protein